MKTLHAHDLEMEKKFDEQTRYVFFEKDPTYGEENRRNKVLIKSFITNQNKQLYIKIARGEIERLESLKRKLTGAEPLHITEWTEGHNCVLKYSIQHWQEIVDNFKKDDNA